MIEVVVRPQKNATVIDLHGRLDASARWDFKAILNQCCLSEHEHLVVNLGGLTFVDSAGLGFLILSYFRFAGMERRMSWVSPRGPVKILLDQLNIHDMIPIFEHEHEALQPQ